MKLDMKHGLFVLILIVSFSLIPTLSAVAAEYPTKPVTLVVPWGPGSAIDSVARAISNGAKKPLGQPVVVENKVGGAGVVGANYVLSKPPDGYTIGITSLNPFIISYHTGTLNFHPVDDFTHIMRVCGYMFAVAVRADAPWKTIQEFIQYCKANPGKVSYGSAGTGSTGHLNMEEFASLAGIQLTHIPYKSGHESNMALLGGHIEALSDAAWAPLVESGKFRALLIYGSERLARYPNVPVPKDVVSANVRPGYLLLFAPKGTPKPVVKRLHDAFKMAMNEPEYHTVLDKFNLTPLYLGSEECEKAVREEIEPMGKLVKKLGLDKK